MEKNINELPKKETVKKRIFTTIVVIIAIVAIGGMFLVNQQKDYKDYFVEYENATTLVLVSYEGDLIYIGVGFIDDDIYEKYRNNEYTEGKIEIYHPYKRGESVIVDINKIQSIETKTYESFYLNYPPNKLR